MADSANILSILASLGQSADQGILPVTFQPPPSAPPVSNVLQAAMAPPPSPTAPLAPVQPPPQAAAPADHPRKRLSVIDVIGRLADAVATVGGSQPMYAPTLEHVQDRANQVDLDALKKTLTQQQVDQGILEPQVAARKRLGTALGAIANNPNAPELWPSIAEQAGIDPQHTAAVGVILKNNPNAAGIFAKALGADIDNLGKNVFFGTDATGKTVAYQVGPDGNPHILDFSAAGVTPSDPIKVVNTGGSSVVIGSGGGVKRILPNTIAPGTIATIQSNEKIATGRNDTALKIAGMPARSKDGTGAGAKGIDGNVPILLDNIASGFADLHRMSALPGEGSGVGQIEGAFSRSTLGQHLGEQLGTPSAQKRLEIMKNVSALQQAMLKSLPASATRTKFEQEMLARGLPDPSKMSYSTAQTVIRQLRESYQNAVAAAAKETAPKIVPVNPKPNVNSGWGKATVVGG